MADPTAEFLARPAADMDLAIGRFHHVGVAVRRLDSAVAQFAEQFGAEAAASTYHDPAQKVNIRFVRLGDLLLEIMEPSDAASPLMPILRRGVALYHICYEVDDMDATLRRLHAPGVNVVSPPTPAVAFDGRRVAFLMSNGLMIELLEAEKRELE